MSEQKLEVTEEEIDIIDFQSEDRSASRESTEVKPIPKNVKYIMGGIALLMLFGMTGLYAYSKKLSDDEMSSVSIDEYEIQKAVGTDELIASLDKTPSTVKKEDIKKRLTLGPVTEQEKLNERVISMEVQIQQMTQQIEDLAVQGKAVRQLNTQVGDISEHQKTVATQSDLDQMKQDFNTMLQKTSDELKTSLAKNYKKAKTYVSKKKYKSKAVPFKLVSIDQWNGVNYAAIQSKKIGAIENLRLGDTRSGWKVERIDTAESSVVFKNIETSRAIKQTAI